MNPANIRKKTNTKKDMVIRILIKLKLKSKTDNCKLDKKQMPLFNIAGKYSDALGSAFQRARDFVLRSCSTKA